MSVDRLKNKEAKILASIVHEIIRHKVSIDVAFKRVCRGVCAENPEERERLYGLAWSFVRDYNALLCINKGRSKPSKLAEMWLSRKGVIEEEALIEPHCRVSVKKWLFDRISSIIGVDESLKLFQSMSRRVWWLRVNLFKASVEKVVSDLEREGVELEIHKHYPYMIKILKTPKPVRQLRSVREFEAIPQDIASTVVVEELNPQAGDVILDACAAPGIKTSLILMLTEGKARVIAVDISRRRLQAMRALLRRLRVPEGSYELRLADARTFRVKDAVMSLIDAPCSNSGAISKDPGLRLTLSKGKVEFYSRIQAQILSNIVDQVSNVVYSVCSILPDEGEYQIQRLIDLRKASLVKPRSPLCKPSYPITPYSNEMCRLYPHLSESEGFFIAHIKEEG